MNDTVLNIILWVSGIILGGIVSYYLNRLFYKKANRKTELTTRLHYSSSTILVDKDVEEDLVIKFRDKEVSYLHQFQFVILNSGDNPIKTPLKPLCLIIPVYYDYISVELNHIHPIGREVIFKLKDSNREIDFLFDILNANEYFIVKLMLSVSKENREKASLEKPEFKFLITSENLPPILKTDLVTVSNYIETSLLEIIKPFGKLLIPILSYFIGFITLGGLFILGLLIKISIENGKYNLLSVRTFFYNFDLWSLFVLLTWILLIPLLIFSILTLLELFRKKQNIKREFEDRLDELPEKILKNW